MDNIPAGLKEVWCWKIVEIESNFIKTLFHGNFRSRILPRGQWLKAEIRLNVQDGNGTPYKSGWHVFLDRGTAESYLKRFKKERWIISCKAKGLRKKEHSRGDVYLANWLFIS